MLLFAFAPLAVAQHIETSTFNQAPKRPAEDPKAVEHGKQVYTQKCASCHAADLRGTDTGVNILRSQPALTDHGNDHLTPIMLGQWTGMQTHKVDISNADAAAVGAYVRSLLALIGSQGRAPYDAMKQPNIVVGDAVIGKTTFAKTCGSCHSVDGDLKGFARRVSSPKLMQQAWLRGTYLGATPVVVTATVTEPGKAAVAGTLIHVDDFLVTLKVEDGTQETFVRNGAVPKVVVKDPLDAHRTLLPKYTDKDIHDITAYLVTLK
ncbi:c-type cytochrome [Terriglobus sp. RCC_193]|uniref:c-type cytochrome n=1 Tax=Terriglobus sp. RCC_193 TaxID=3239218 RepID=UPI003523B0C9